MRAGRIHSCRIIVSAIDPRGELWPVVPMDIVYRTSDPYAITFVFDSNGEIIEWNFGRDLLASGVVAQREFGEGDVRIWNDNGTLRINLFNGEEGIQLSTSHRAVVIKFIKEIYNAVPEGFESNLIDVDHALREIFS